MFLKFKVKRARIARANDQHKLKIMLYTIKYCLYNCFLLEKLRCQTNEDGKPMKLFLLAVRSMLWMKKSYLLKRNNSKYNKISSYSLILNVF